MKIRLQKELDRITELLTELSKYISIKTENNEYGINAILENILQGLFNIVFDCRLENLNHYQKNYPAVDLEDFGKGIAIQVTTEDIYRILSQKKDLQQIMAARKYLEKHLSEQKQRFAIVALEAAFIWTWAGMRKLMTI